MQRLSPIATLTPKADTSEAADTAIPVYDELILYTLCDEFGFLRFSPEEINFIHMFVDAMRPLACASNSLQGEKSVFLEYLAPIIVQLRNDLNGLLGKCTMPTATHGLITCRPPKQNIVQSVKIRL